MIACSATLSSAAAYEFTWERPPGFDGEAGPFFADDDAGILNSLTLTYDTDTQNLTLLVAFSESPDTGLLPEGLAMIINNGPEPSGDADEFAVLWLNARGDDPLLKATTYGPPWHRERIVASWDDDSWINNLSVTDVDDTRVFAFDIDASEINGFEPSHGDVEDWFGIGFDELVGMWLKTYAWDWPTYDENDDDCHLGQHHHWHHYRPRLERGHFDFANQPTGAGNNDIPEPTSAALLTLGALALCRRTRNRDVR